MIHEYAFDVKLRAVIRVKAESEASARVLLDTVDAMTFDDIKSDDPDVLHVTEFSIATEEDRGNGYLFEVDGVDVDDLCRECLRSFPQAGDGYDGYCPDCADRRSNDPTSEEA